MSLSGDHDDRDRGAEAERERDDADRADQRDDASHERAGGTYGRSRRDVSGADQLAPTPRIPQHLSTMIAIVQRCKATGADAPASLARTLGPSEVLALQRAAGNAAATGFVEDVRRLEVLRVQRVEHPSDRGGGIRERIDEATGVDKGQSYRDAMLGMSAFYRHQQQDALAAQTSFPARDRIDQATGVAHSPHQRAAQANLRSFYTNQQQEAGAVTEVHSHRVEQQIDKTTGIPVTTNGQPDGYRINGRFDARRFGYDQGQSLMQLTIRINLVPHGATKADVERVKAATRAAVDHYYNPGHRFKTGERLNLSLEFVDKPNDAHMVVNLYAGGGHIHQTTWFVQNEPTEYAHEIGHQLGLVDEYEDQWVVPRETRASRGVHHDNSLMGNYWRHDAAGNPYVDPKTQLHGRHLDQIESDISFTRAQQAAHRGTPPPGASPGPSEQQEA